MSKKQIRRRVQVCESGLLGHHQETLARLRESGCTVEAVSCLDQCTRCEVCAVALVAGRFVVASSPEAFLAKLRLS